MQCLVQNCTFDAHIYKLCMSCPDEDAKELDRQRRLLCLPKSDIDAIQRETCGRLFQAVSCQKHHVGLPIVRSMKCSPFDLGVALQQFVCALAKHSYEPCSCTV